MLRTTVVFTALPDPTVPFWGLSPTSTSTSSLVRPYPIPRPPPRRISVLVSPRLDSTTMTTFSPVLGNFEFGQQAWPDLLRAATLQLELDGVMSPVTLASADQLDSDLWNRLLPPSTPVTLRQLPGDNRTIRSYPVIDVVNAIEYTYGQVGSTWPRDPAPVRYPSGEANVLGSLIGQVAHVAGDVHDHAFADEDATFSSYDVRRAFYWAQRFYTRSNPRLPPETLSTNRPPVTQLDFHQRLSMLADHTALLRMLGLVFDVYVPVASFNQAGGTVRVHCNWRPGGSLDWSPKTHYLFAGASLQAAPRSAPIADGYLALERPDFSVVQMDADGAALQTVKYASAVQRLVTDPTRPPADQQTLPSLRTGGINIVHSGRAAWLTARQMSTVPMDQNLANADLYAEDLLRGYRVDVETEGDGNWMSLCRRNAELQIVGRTAPVEAFDDEGQVRAASGTSTTANDELYLHETVVGWDGWSLAARRPGRSITHVNGQEQVADQPNTDQGLGLTAEYTAVSGSLPRLRFGKHYRLRARTVDLANQSVPYYDGNATHATASALYGRYEPVPAPTLVFHAPIGPGESIEHLVIRTFDDHTEASCMRHVVAPKGSLALAEAHGKLDGAFVAGTDPKPWFGVARMEGGTLLDRTVVDPQSGADVAITGMSLQYPPSSTQTGSPPWPAHRGDGLGEGQYVVHGEDSVRMPYLPDPMATGIVLRDPAGGTVSTTSYPSTSIGWAGEELVDWPLKQSIALALYPATGQAPVVSSPSQQVIAYALPPGRSLRLRYSSSIDTSKLTHMALYNLLVKNGLPPSVESDIDAGLHWMFTPSRELQLTHAVQRPVTSPRLENFQFVRDLGATTVRFVENNPNQGSLVVDSASTSHVDVRAAWRDWVDDPSDASGLRRDARAQTAFQIPIVDGADHTSLTVTTQSAQRTPFGGQLPGVNTWGPQPAPMVRPAVHDLGDTRHHVVNYLAVGTTRFAEYFPPSITTVPGNLEASGMAIGTSLPSTAAPPVPVIAQIVPTFQWSEAGGVRTRKGRGLRIYLARPWFATGEGERLAVVIPTSRWGHDPAWTGGNAPLFAGSFPRSTENVTYFATTSEPVAVPRVQFGSVAIGAGIAPIPVVGYAPEWNDERKLWFVDVQLDNTSAYFPFVSLSLARWQPSSLPYFELSNQVRCDFAQLAPDRAASVTTNGGYAYVSVVGVTAGNSFEPQLGSLSGPRVTPGGFTYHDGTAAASHRMYARIEQLAPGLTPGPDNDLSWTALPGQIELIAVANPLPQVNWTGSLPIPASPTGALRCVITETEAFASDSSVTGSRERVVYLDSFGL